MVGLQRQEDWRMDLRGRAETAREYARRVCTLQQSMYVGTWQSASARMKLGGTAEVVYDSCPIYINR